MCDNVYDCMKKNLDKFDTSDYPENNVFEISHRNKKVLGLMKDECCESLIAEFAGTRSKAYGVRMYAILEERKKLKVLRKML